MKKIYQQPLIESFVIESGIPITATVTSGDSGIGIGDWNPGDEEELEG